MLPPDSEWKIDIIDTWNMTLTPVKEVIRPGDKLELPGKPWIALRLQRL